MYGVTGGVRRVGRMIVANVFAVETARGRWLLVDSGHVVERWTLLAELRAAGIGPDRLDGVLLTHRHSDHAGNARWLQRQGVPIICHRADAEVLAGRKLSPPLRRRGASPQAFVAGALAEWENKLPIRLEPDRVVEDREEVLGLEVRWMPGHTEGSAFYLHGPTRTLFSGDTLLAALPPLVRRRGLALPYPTFCVDHDGALQSLRRFARADVAFDVLCAGHGPPLVDRASSKVRDFLEGALAPTAPLGLFARAERLGRALLERGAR